MKLSIPVINTIRFDTDLKLIVGKNGVSTKSSVEGYCLPGLDTNGKDCYAVGIRIKLTFYVERIENEAAGYLSETESTVLSFLTPLEDMHMLGLFSEDVFNNIIHNLQIALPEFDLTSLGFPDKMRMAYYLSDGLIKLGMYK